jgi:hypothetical protein
MVEAEHKISLERLQSIPNGKRYYLLAASIIDYSAFKKVIAWVA